MVLDQQALPCLLNLLKNNYKKSIKKEACWTISNITAGNADQIQVSFVYNIWHLTRKSKIEVSCV